MTNSVTENEFNLLADAVLERLDGALEASGVDLDWELKAGGVLEIELADGSKIIVNRHGTAREIWVAARSGGFHYRYDAAAKDWLNTRDGEALFPALTRLVSQQAGEAVDLG
jgi:CyaY protein